MFNGDPSLWTSFWDRFAVLVNGTDSSEVTKFTYLLSALDGEAKSALNGLLLTSCNYKVAIDNL